MRTPIYDGLFQTDLDADGFKLIGLHTPTASGDAATKGYVDAHAGGGGGGGGFEFDVTTYGATGDGVTDDTTAIQDALAAIPSTGGLLYFPAGIYKYTGTTLTLNRQITVMGEGGGTQFFDAVGFAHIYGARAISTIDFNSSTGTLFTVAAHGCAFRNIALRNPRTTAPTAGAGIVVSSAGDRTTYDGISVDGFYIDIDVQAGSCQVFNNCWISGPVLYGLKLRNILVPDGGDHCISNCYFYTSKDYPGVSAIRIESGGGIKIINCKVNVNSAPYWVNGIDLAVANSITTVDLLISNCSIENYSAYGIKGRTGTSSLWGSIVIDGNQFFTGANAIDLQATAAGDFNGVAITGNFSWSDVTGSMINLVNCTNVGLANNVKRGHTDGMVTIGAGVTFADCPVYIGRDARLVSISSGVKLEVRNTGTDAWVEATRYTNP